MQMERKNKFYRFIIMTNLMDASFVVYKGLSPFFVARRVGCMKEPYLQREYLQFLSHGTKFSLKDDGLVDIK